MIDPNSPFSLDHFRHFDLTIAGHARWYLHRDSNRWKKEIILSYRLRKLLFSTKGESFKKDVLDDLDPEFGSAHELNDEVVKMMRMVEDVLSFSFTSQSQIIAKTIPQKTQQKLPGFLSHDFVLVPRITWLLHIWHISPLYI